MKTTVFNIAFTMDQFPPKNDPEFGDSDVVLIDETGERKFFTLGYYDYDDNEWVDETISEVIDSERLHKMRWMYLPLAKYDK